MDSSDTQQEMVKIEAFTLMLDQQLVLKTEFRLEPVSVRLKRHFRFIITNLDKMIEQNKALTKEVATLRAERIAKNGIEIQ